MQIANDVLSCYQHFAFFFAKHLLNKSHINKICVRARTETQYLLFLRNGEETKRFRNDGLDLQANKNACHSRIIQLQSMKLKYDALLVMMLWWL